MSSKRLIINMLANVLSLFVNIGISFFLTPYLVNTLGTEAYGFFPLANNFINYINIILSSLNSMAGMFISTRIYKDDYEEAEIYFNSTLIANLFLSIVTGLFSVFFVFNIHKILNVPKEIINDVRILFSSIFLSNIVVLLNVTFSVATFVRNRLDLASIRDIIVNLIKVAILILLFTLLTPSISYLGIINLISMIIIFLTNIYFTKKLLPIIKVSFKKFRINVIWDIISSGIWNTINKLSNTLLDGLDLMIANVMIDATSMGVLAVAKMVPNFINTFILTLAGVFMPKFVEAYALDNADELVINIKSATKILGVFSTIPVALLIVYGKVFFDLWVPNEDAQLLQALSLLTIGGLFVSGCMSALPNVFTATNNLKIPSLVLFFTGVTSTILVFLLLKFTHIGIFAIAGVSTVFNIIRNLTFIPIYAAKCINKKWYIFFPEIFKSIFSLIIITPILYIISCLNTDYSWGLLIFYASIGAILGLYLNSLIVLTKEERKKIIYHIKKEFL